MCTAFSSLPMIRQTPSGRVQQWPPSQPTIAVGAGSQPALSQPAPTKPAPSQPTIAVGAGSQPAPSQPAPTTTKRHGLSEIVRQFKTFSARHINDLRGTPGIPLWQRNYYEHIIRNDGELDRIRQYIHDNPANWTEDEDNPDTGCGNRRPCNGTPKLRPGYYMPQKGGKS